MPLFPLLLRPCARLLVAVALLPALAEATAGEAQLDALAGAPMHDRFIVTWRDGPARVQASGAARDPLAMAAAAVPVRRGAALQVQRVRALALGPEVVASSRALDRVEAGILMRSLAADPAVLRVEVDQLLQPARVPNDPRFPAQWQFKQDAVGINIQPAWDITGGAGTVVAIIDTGVRPHPDLVGNLLAGHDFISDPVSAGDGDGRDGNADDEGDWTRAGECSEWTRASYSSWHGTQVAGIAGARADNREGIAGVAHDAGVLPVRVMGKCGARTSDVLDAIVWSAGGEVPGVPANPHPAEAINLSMSGWGECSASYRQAIDAAVSRGTTVVVAAGNRAGDAANALPANCPNVIAVAGSNYMGRRMTMSNHGAIIDITAPGQDILTTRVSGATTAYGTRYEAEHGTSMAAPHVAGVVALMQAAAARPLTPGRIERILRQTARPMPVACPEGCGAGLLDAGAAVAAARAEGAVAPAPAPAAPRSLALSGLAGARGAELAYTIDVPAGRTLSVRINGGSGDADLYVDQGRAPTQRTWLCRPYRIGNEETCTIAPTVAGRYHIRIHAYTTISGVALNASY